MQYIFFKVLPQPLVLRTMLTFFHFIFRFPYLLFPDCLRVDAYHGFAVVTQNPSLYDTSDLTRASDLTRC